MNARPLNKFVICPKCKIKYISGYLACPKCNEENPMDMKESNEKEKTNKNN